MSAKFSQIAVVIFFAAAAMTASSIAKDTSGCALDIPGQRFDLPERDQALAPLRACYEKHIRLAPRTTDESALVQDLMDGKCRGETANLLSEVAGKGLSPTPQEDRKVVECWARGVARWVRK